MVNSHTTARWSDVFKYRIPFSVHVEASTRCNSRCVLCPRFIGNTPITDPNLNLTEIKINEFKEWFPKDVLKLAVQFHFCGNFGDPTACVDLAEIVEYLIENNVPNVIVRTNGGARDVRFWTKMGSLLTSPNRSVVFSVDGLESTNHLYRREVKWKTLVRNIKAFTSSGGYATQDFLVFKHNEHQIEEAKEYAKEIGIKELSLKSPFGLEDEKTKVYIPNPAIDKDGNITHWLEKADMFKNSEFSEDTMSYEERASIALSKTDIALKEAKAGIVESVYTKDHDYLQDTTIDCIVLKGDIHSPSIKREVFLNPNGDVAPCCYLGFITDPHYPTNDLRTRELLKPFNELNLNHSKLQDIFSVFDKKIADNWIKTHLEGRSLTCTLTCGKRQTNAADKSNLIRSQVNLT